MPPLGCALSDSPLSQSPPDGSSEEPQFGTRLKAARAGRLDARGELLQQCRQYLLAAARRQLPADLNAKFGASDLAQEALTIGHQHFERFTGDTEEELTAWLRRILEYRLLTLQRNYRDTGKRAVRRELPLQPTNDSNDYPSYLAIDTPRPESRVASQEEHVRLEEAIGRLSAGDREIIELRNTRLLSFVEIARLTNRTADAARKHWARAVEHLAEELIRSP